MAIALQRRDHYGSESTSVWIESYEMAVFGSADTALPIVKEVCGRGVEQTHRDLLRKTSASQVNPEDNEAMCPITYTWLTLTVLITPQNLIHISQILTHSIPVLHGLMNLNTVLHECY